MTGSFVGRDIVPEPIITSRGLAFVRDTSIALLVLQKAGCQIASTIVVIEVLLTTL